MKQAPERLTSLLEECKSLAFDLNFTYAKQWKEKSKYRLLVGFLPIYVPREIIHAANGLPVGIMGAGDRKQIMHAAVEPVLVQNEARLADRTIGRDERR